MASVASTSSPRLVVVALPSWRPPTEVKERQPPLRRTSGPSFVGVGRPVIGAEGEETVEERERRRGGRSRGSSTVTRDVSQGRRASRARLASLIPDACRRRRWCEWDEPGARAQCHVRAAGRRLHTAGAVARPGHEGRAGPRNRPALPLGESGVARTIDRTAWPATSNAPHDRVLAVNRRTVFARDHHRCQYCGSTAESIDHVVPRSRGGLHVWDNVVAACRRCNTRKEDRLPNEVGLVLRSHPTAPRQRVWLLATTGALRTSGLPTWASSRSRREVSGGGRWSRRSRFGGAESLCGRWPATGIGCEGI